jgi:hypothetical protein
LLLSFDVSTQVVPQYVRPVAQQWLLVQCGVVPVHAVPQPPQLALSLVKSWQPSLQHAEPEAHIVPHDWQWRVSLGTHALLQQRPVPQSAHAPPQWRASFVWQTPAQQTWLPVQA